MTPNQPPDSGNEAFWRDFPTARLASVAAAGEILVTIDAALAAGLDPTLEHRTLELKGKQAVTEVVSLGA